MSKNPTQPSSAARRRERVRDDSIHRVVVYEKTAPANTTVLTEANSEGFLLKLDRLLHPPTPPEAKKQSGPERGE